MTSTKHQQNDDINSGINEMTMNKQSNNNILNNKEKMKIRTLLLTVLFAAVGFCSCSKDDDSAKPAIEVETPTLTLPTADMGTVTTTFTTNQSWTLSLGDPAPTWFTVDKLAGEPGKHTLTITIKENNLSYTDQRKGTITISAGPKTATITVVQPVKPAEKEKQTWTGTEYPLQTPKEKGNILVSVPTSVEGSAKLILPAELKAEDNPNITIDLAEGASFTESLTIEDANYTGTIILRAANNETIAVGTATPSAKDILMVNLPKGSFLIEAGKINGSAKATTNPDTFILNGVIEGDLTIEGGSLIIGPTGKVKGAIIMKGNGSLLVDGTVEGTITGGDITIGSTGVTGDIVVTEDGKIKVNEGAKVNGSVDASKAKEADIADGTVSGQVTPPAKPDKPTPVEGVSFAEATVSIAKGSTKQLVYKISPLTATNQKVSWKSSDATVASVSETGLVTANAAGTATITVTTEDGKKTATCTVTVTEKPVETVAVTGVTLNKTAASLLVGATETLTATVNPTNATNKAVTWSSSNAAVATVSAAGVVTAVSNGTATITVTTADGKKTATCTVTVITPVTGVTLNKTAASLLVGATETLTATVNPTNATNKAVTWTSSDAAVASVSAAGVVTAQAVGTATITVTTEDGKKTATCTVTVNPIVVTGVSLDKTSATLVRAKTEALTATVNPTNATNKAVTWTSSNDAIVSVDAKGNVTGVKVGTATITVTTTDGGKTAACTITVIDPANPGGITADSWGNETGGSLNTH